MSDKSAIGIFGLLGLFVAVAMVLNIISTIKFMILYRQDFAHSGNMLVKYVFNIVLKLIILTFVIVPYSVQAIKEALYPYR